MAGTDTSKEFVFRPSPAIILVEPQLGENIGTAARAMANFGLWDMRLVAPRDGWPNPKAVAAAAKADHVIDRVQVFDTLAEAIADLTLVYATTARSREMFKPVIGPDVAADTMTAHIGAGHKAGILFGRERWGLNNEEVSLANAIVTLPVEPAFASLNIAQAVLVLAYEWRRAALSGEPLPFDEDKGVPATGEEMVGLVEQLGDALDRSNFFKSPGKRPGMMNNIRSMFTRAGFNQQEVRTLRGIIASLDRRHERPNPFRVKKGE
ncbi:RNA methyltransferase [Pelagibacterium lentulum]|uniref:tRNA (cytidine/uridine-2'-O-)-methyltransferase TrmJ n=1 Tax=Pelagibacterium lentulum TaxID=2029865 RepID=A0A916RBG1_9HYPH|nr:RNA methyltransferase [Pelagibacterium lentulum]GGA47937.1 tRNA (cytidine/uridine-2'-O-)-methyltransferase TrmJ [Pelagibacterium lentulum]